MVKVQDILNEGEVIQGNFPKNGKVLLSMRRDEGDEWKYWTGVNWFGTKSKAAPVDANKAEGLLSKWGLKANERTRLGHGRIQKYEAEN